LSSDRAAPGWTAKIRRCADRAASWQVGKPYAFGAVRAGPRDEPCEYAVCAPRSARPSYLRRCRCEPGADGA
jgi:hypothetical protein